MDSNPAKHIKHLSDNFDWEALTGVWLKEPFLLKRSCMGQINPAWLLNVLRSVRTTLGAGKPVRINFYDRDMMCVTGWTQSKRLCTGVERLLPSDNHSLQLYFERLRSVPRFERFGISLGNLQINFEFWSFTRQFLRLLYMNLPLPGRYVYTSTFIGNYEHTPAGAHQDPFLHGLMFMVEGKRTMRFWKPHVGERLFGTGNTVRNYVAGLGDSFTFELEAGDVLYIPPYHWHVGENTEDPSVAINIDFQIPVSSTWEGELLLKLLDGEASKIGARFLPPLRESPFGVPVDPSEWILDPPPATLIETAQKVANAITSRDFELSVHEGWVQMQSALGLKAACQPRSGTTITYDTVVKGDPDFPVLLLVAGDQMLIGCNGKVFRRDAREFWRKLVKLINSGNPCSVRELAGKLECGEPAKEALLLMQALWEHRGVEVIKTSAKPH